MILESLRIRIIASSNSLFSIWQVAVEGLPHRKKNQGVRVDIDILKI